MKKIWCVLLLVILVAGCKQAGIPIEDEFGNTIVYSQEEGFSVDDYKAHCYERNGVFNTCGSPCSPDAEQCIQVCAYTCQIFE